MKRMGPYMRQRANPSTTWADWRPCYLWLDQYGRITMIEWL